jgi:hypothetical protein
VACAAPTRRKPQLRRTRSALARSERPSERHCTLNVEAPPRARCILSCFLRDQLYPGIRDKNLKRRGIAGEGVSGKVCLPGRGTLEDVSGLYPGE